MAVQYICDGCGKTETVRTSTKPWEWFQRTDEDGEQHACSRQCIERTAAKSGKTGLVFPV